MLIVVVANNLKFVESKYFSRASSHWIYYYTMVTIFLTIMNLCVPGHNIPYFMQAVCIYVNIINLAEGMEYSDNTNKPVKTAIFSRFYNELVRQSGIFGYSMAKYIWLHIKFGFYRLQSFRFGKHYD